MSTKEVFHWVLNSFEVSLFIIFSKDDIHHGKLLAKWKSGVSSFQMTTLREFVNAAKVFKSASIAPCELTDDQDYETTLGRPYKSEGKNICLYLVTNNGELLLVSFALAASNNDPASLTVKELGRTHLTVVWMGTIGGDPSSLRGGEVCVVHSTGDCMMLRSSAGSASSAHEQQAPKYEHQPSKDCMGVWHYFTIPGPVLAADKHSASIIVCDGSRYVRLIKLQPSCASDGSCSVNDCICVKKSPVTSVGCLQMMGVLDVKCDGEGCVYMATVDGRAYKYKWDEFLELVETKEDPKEEKLDDCNDDRENIDDMLSRIDECNRMIIDAQENKEDLNSYIQQLNIVQSLICSQSKSYGKYISNLQKYFFIDYSIEHSAEDEFMFNVTITLTNTLTDIKFNYKWWNGKVSIHLAPATYHKCFNLNGQDNKCSVTVPITSESIKNLLKNSFKTDHRNASLITWSLILKDYYNSNTLCAVEISKLPMKISHFLNSSLKITGDLKKPTSFSEFLISNFSQCASDDDCPRFASSKANGKEENIALHELKMQLPASPELITTLANILMQLSIKDSKDRDAFLKQLPLSKDLWLCDLKVTLRVSTATTGSCSSPLTIVVRGAAVPLLIVIKRELEQCSINNALLDINKTSTGDVNLSAKLVKDLRDTKHLLDLAVDYPFQDITLMSCYSQVCMLSSQMTQ